VVLLCVIEQRQRNSLQVVHALITANGRSRSSASIDWQQHEHQQHDDAQNGQQFENCQDRDPFPLGRAACIAHVRAAMGVFIHGANSGTVGQDHAERTFKDVGEFILRPSSNGPQVTRRRTRGRKVAGALEKKMLGGDLVPAESNGDWVPLCYKICG
jgi:hypothetical protein